MSAVKGELLTTAMAVMPYRDVGMALELALRMDVPFWPQLPNLSYLEDMYVQASEHFPGILLDMDARTLRFSEEKFAQELPETLAHFEEPDYFDISETYSEVYHRFLALDLKERPAIRGQLEGPISFGLNVLDTDDRPIIFNDNVRPFMLEVMAKRVNVQLGRLKKMNKNAFMYIDEPGLQFIFSGMSGYNDIAAKRDMEHFFSLLDRPRGVHLCGNPDWDFLLTLDLDVLSLDVYLNGEVFSSYERTIKDFLARGGVIGWGIVPTNVDYFYEENIDSLEARLLNIWAELEKKGIDRELMVSQSHITPATCCLAHPECLNTVALAFDLTNELAERLRHRYRAYIT